MLLVFLFRSLSPKGTPNIVTALLMALANGYNMYYWGADDGRDLRFGNVSVPPAKPSRLRGNGMISSPATAPTIPMCRMDRLMPLITAGHIAAHRAAQSDLRAH